MNNTKDRGTELVVGGIKGGAFGDVKRCPVLLVAYLKWIVWTVCVFSPEVRVD
jgi:hypothetical protein